MGLVPAALLLVGTHCAEEKQESAAVPDPDPIIAQVGDRAIPLGQFRAFSRDIPQYLQSEKTGIERVRNHLQTMIDRELLALEALDQGIDQSPRFLKNMRRFKEKRLLAVFQAREIRVKITREEVAEYFEREGLSKAVRFDEILVEGEDKAAAVVGELRAGKSFSEVAKKYSSGRADCGQRRRRGRLQHPAGCPSGRARRVVLPRGGRGIGAREARRKSLCHLQTHGCGDPGSQRRCTAQNLPDTLHREIHRPESGHRGQAQG